MPRRIASPTKNGRKVHLSLAFNPSHLEWVNAVVEGRVRAQQDRDGRDPERKKVLPVLIHGDAAFAGQGLVAEGLNLANLEGYKTGGTVHLAVPSYRSALRLVRVTGERCGARLRHLGDEDPDAVREGALQVLHRAER